MRATAWMGSFLRALTSCPADADGLVMNAMKLTIAATAAVLLASAAPAGAKTYVGAPLELGQYDLVALERPKTLLLGPPGGSLAEMMLVRRVRWSSWGSPNATARGVHKTKDYDPWASVRLRAYGRRTCAAGQPGEFKLYTRVKTTAYGHTTTWKMPSCSTMIGWMD